MQATHTQSPPARSGVPAPRTLLGLDRFTLGIGIAVAILVPLLFVLVLTRNERSEWRTARRAVDRRGSAAPFIAEQPAQSRLYGRRPATEQAFRFTWLDLD